MTFTNPKTNRPLTPHQIVLLQTLYKFRFATAKLIAEQQHANSTQVILARLKRLVDQGYIGQKYESSYKLLGKPASYHLLLGGIRYLRQQPYANTKVLKNIYYDRNAEEETITHYLQVFATYNKLNQLYPDDFNLFSQTELRDKKYLPKPRPDAHIKRKEMNKTLPNDYFLFTIEPGGFWSHRRKVRAMIEYAERETWEKATKRPLPTILLVCESKALEHRMKGIAERELETSYVNLKFEVATLVDLDSLITQDTQ